MSEKFWINISRFSYSYTQYYMDVPIAVLCIYYDKTLH